jgi:hypothetical protein
MINHKQNEAGQIYIASSRRDDRTAHTVGESWTVQMVVHGLRNGMNFQSSLLPSSVRWSSSRTIPPRVRLRNIFQVPNHGVCSCITSAQAVEPKELSADIKIVSGVNKSRGIVLTSGDGWRSCSAVDNVVKPRRSLQNVQRDDREGSQSVTWRQWRKN